MNKNSQNRRNNKINRILMRGKRGCQISNKMRNKTMSRYLLEKKMKVTNLKGLQNKIRKLRKNVEN
mgnify:CR=1 FL=1